MGSTALWLMLLLGAYHGINPGMGWLFAVALGMQEQKGSAVAKVARARLRSATRFAIGGRRAGRGVSRHGAAAQRGHPLSCRRGPGRSWNLSAWCGHRHPRWVRMQVGFRDLMVWSFLMASAHGAGLMVLPVLLGSGPGLEAANHTPGHTHLSTGVRPLAGLLATGVHTVGYLAVTGAVALGCLSEAWPRSSTRTAWLNLDVVVGRCRLVITGAGHTGDVAVGT